MKNIWYMGNGKMVRVGSAEGLGNQEFTPNLTSFLHRKEKAPCEGQSSFLLQRKGQWCGGAATESLWQGAKASCSSCNTSCALTYWDTCQKLAAWQGKLEVQWLPVLYILEQKKEKESKGLTIRKIIRLVSISLHVCMFVDTCKCVYRERSRWLSKMVDSQSF